MTIGEIVDLLNKAERCSESLHDKRMEIIDDEHELLQGRRDRIFLYNNEAEEIISLLNDLSGIVSTMKIPIQI